MTSTWTRRPQVWIALAVFVLAFAVYAATTSPTIVFWDCGEFISCSHILGIPHQPGTPLYVLMGRVFDILFGSSSVDQPSFDTARAVNFMSVFFSALAVMFAYLVVLRVARRADPDSGWLAHAGGLVGALFLMLSETYWNNAIEAEVYGLSAFMMSFVTWLALRWYETRSEARSERLLYLMIYLLGLGVGFHLGSLLVYPGIVLMMILARRRHLPLVDLVLMSFGLGLFLLSTMLKDDTLLLSLLVIYLGVGIFRSFSGRHFVLIGSGLFLLGLTVHLMMLLRAPLDPAINQSQPENFESLMSVLRREQYPPLNPFERRAPLGWQFQYYYNFFVDQFTFLSGGAGWLVRTATFVGPIFLGLLGIFHGIRRARPVIWILIGNYLINGEILTLYLNFTQNEVRLRDYFYFAAFLFFALLIGIGAAALLRYAAGPEGKSAGQLESGEKPPFIATGLLPKVAAGLLLLIAALPMIQPGHAKWFEHDRSENKVAYEYAWNILAGVDEGAILFTNGDNDTFPIWYLQEVEHFRRDVTVVNLSLINLPWYVEQMRRRDPPMPILYSDDQVEALTWKLYEDPETGHRTLIYVRDYVVYNIIQTNAQSESPRPVFFAVTIPRDNMKAYYPDLQMEGLIFRLLRVPGSDDASRRLTSPGLEGKPEADEERLLANLLGVYQYDGLMDGDNARRQARFRELVGAGDQEPPDKVAKLAGRTTYPSYDEILDLMGQKRRDVFLSRNTTYLLGNYPAALIEATYKYMLRADSLMAAGRLAAADTAQYDFLVDRALSTMEFASRLEPTLEPVVDFLPLFLVEKGRSEEALAYLDGVADRIAVELYERSLYRVVLTMARAGSIQQALRHLEGAIAREPDRKFFYELSFKLEQTQDSLEGCRRVLEAWQQRSGDVDQNMVRIIEDMQREALDREQERIEQSVEGSP